MQNVAAEFFFAYTYSQNPLNCKREYPRLPIGPCFTLLTHGNSSQASVEMLTFTL